MKIPAYLPVKHSQIPNLPSDTKWVDTALAPRDDTLKTHSQALAGRLTFQDNVNADVRDVVVTHDTAFVLRASVNGPVLGVFAISCDAFDYPVVAWEPVDTTRVRIKVYFLGSTTSATVRLVILGSA